MKKHITAMSIFLLMTILFSCDLNKVANDPLPNYDQTELVVKAKTYLNLFTQKNQLARLASSKFGEKTPVWDKAVAVRYKGKQLVEVPLLYNGRELTYSVRSPLFEQIKTGRKSVTKALFFIKNGEVSSMYIMKLALDERYIKAHEVTQNFEDLSLDNLKKKAFSGFLRFADWQENIVDSYCYKDGKIIGTTSQGSEASAQGRQRDCQDVYNCRYTQTCIIWGCCTLEESAFLGSCCEFNPHPTCDSGYTECWKTGEQVCDPEPEPEPEEHNQDLDCASFSFTQTSSNWQEAGVKGFRLNIAYMDGTGRQLVHVEISGQIVIGMPVTRANGNFIPAGSASEIAAFVVDQAADLTFRQYRSSQGQPDPHEVERTFRNWLQDVARVNGVNASTNGSGNSHIIVNQSAFAIIGRGNCN